MVFTEEVIASNEVREKCREFVITNDQLFRIKEQLENEIKKGLSSATHSSALVKCFPTYVQDLPNGKEKGKFLALDLGGTNFRVLIIHLNENHFDMQSKIYPIPESIMLGPGTQLFDHIAECLANFMRENNIIEERLPLGFTFSFPLRQEALTTGFLVHWTKGFNCDGVVGKDVVKLLQDALKRRNDVNIDIKALINDTTGTLVSCAYKVRDCKMGVILGVPPDSLKTDNYSHNHSLLRLFKDVQIDVCAILNDTTGTLMSCAWKNHNCRIGLIVGTGSNACYVEKLDAVETFKGDKLKKYVIINTEWGAFGDDGSLDFIRTSFDKFIDKNSINPGKQLFEKMISGMYMGEIVRLVLEQLTKNGVLFNGTGSEDLFTAWKFPTKYVSEIESDKKGEFYNCQKVLNSLGLGHATLEDCANVRYVCQCVSTRAAHIVSAGIATLIDRMGQNSVTVGVDGSVYRYHPHFHDLMKTKTSELLGSRAKFDFMLSEDGSGRGAALVAAVACRWVQEQKKNVNVV